MTSVLRLCIHGVVPIGVVEDHRVRARQVHSDSTRSSRHDEAEDLRVGVETLHHRLKILYPIFFDFSDKMFHADLITYKPIKIENNTNFRTRSICFEISRILKTIILI